MNNPRSLLIAANRAEFGADYARLTFPSEVAAADASRLRQDLLERIAGRSETGCKGTKLGMQRLSPGCRKCVEGSWSCLFLTDRCNVRCFYCPAPQEEDGVPTTNSVPFERPQDYVDYLERFGFTGTSISGGEPLLFPARTIGFLSAIKERFGNAVHTWLYTNGTRLDAQMVSRLSDAGLDEIRFDIGAIDYRLDKAALAVERIPCVTVEIPAVPEEKERLRAKLVEMHDLGINHLNLHQLRLTRHNLPHFLQRPYTYLHGKRITVLESELTALELIAHTLEARIDLPVNYCSFVYKNRFQGQAARARNGTLVASAWEDLTENGYLRSLTLLGHRDDIARQAEIFGHGAEGRQTWSLNSARDGLSFSADLWPRVEFAPFRLRLAYAEVVQRPAVTYRHPFTEVKLPSGRKVVLERLKSSADAELTGEQIHLFAQRYLDGGASPLPETPPWDEIERCETVPAGLQEYF